MIVVYNLHIRKRQIVSYLQHFYHFDFVYQKEGNYIMPTIYLSSRKRETVSYLQYVYHLDFVHQKEGNCIILTVCLWYRHKRSPDPSSQVVPTFHFIPSYAPVLSCSSSLCCEHNSTEKDKNNYFPTRVGEMEKSVY